MVATDKGDLSDSYGELLPADVRDVFLQTYKKFTNVQVRAGSYLLSHNDVVVESPTGSGKTLAFLLPMFAILKKKAPFAKHAIGALILSPSRELAIQIATVAAPYAEKQGLTIGHAIGGGNKSDANLKKLVSTGCNILIATPGRLYRLLQMDKDDKIRRGLKNVEILIVDEADRFNEMQFELHLKEILAALPKQRRTGLFSATQAKEREDLVIFGLRNQKTIKLKEADNVVCPIALNNFYTISEAAEKVSCMVEFIRSKPDKKILVFFPSCFGVRYFKAILDHVVTKRSLQAVDGRNTQKQRTDQIAKFAKSDNGVMLCTDVMSRGIDIEDIDWVIQFEVPKLSSWFVHRAGRTGRSGREGNALLMLTPQQEAYIKFVQTHEQVELKKISVTTNSADKAEQLRLKMIKLACSDREILEQGSRAFVCHIESYVKHDCSIVCGLKEFDVPGLAHAYGLLRLPKMREIAIREDLHKFKRSDIDTSTIKYTDAKQEASRDTVMANKKVKKVAVLKAKAIKKAEKEKRLNGGRTPMTKEEKEADQKKAKERKRKYEQSQQEEKDDFDADVRLLKKIKKGRITKSEMKNLKF